jgi:AraC-like DNA-binding protein
LSGSNPAASGLDAAPTAVYAELPPPPELASHACCVWTQTAGPDGHVQRVLPDGCADIVWMAGGDLVVAGPATGHVIAEIPAGVTAIGVRFGPGAAGRELTDRMALESPARRLGLLAAVLAQGLRDAAPPDPVVSRAASLLASGMPVAETGREVALGERHLRRRFHDAVGYGPKTLQRIMRLRRFLELVEAMPAPDVGRAAVEVGYSDQPHLTRESTALTGLSPVALLDSRLARALADGVRRR